MTRGFFGVALDSPKCKENVGSVLRAAHVFGAAFVTIANARNNSIKTPTNTTAAHRHIPTYIEDDVLDFLPYDTQVVAVDLVENAESLVTFKHPTRCIYVFGAEDATLGRRILSRSQHRVMLPTRYCLNLAACVNVVLYDRMAKELR